MAKSVFFFGDGQAEGDPKRRDLLGGKGAGLAEMTSLGLPVPPGFTIATDGLQRVREARSSIPDDVRGRGRRGARAAREVDGRSPGRRRGAAARERALGRARVDARHDGHHPEPGPERRRGRGARREAREPALRVRRVPPLHRDAREHRARRLEGAVRPRARRGARPRRGGEGHRPHAPQRRGAEAQACPTRDIPAEELEGARHALQGDREEGDGQATSRRDPREQLWQAIEAVFRSWNNHRAIVYRRMHDIPDDWGTACNVQAMVFGNLGDTSATGVAFTRDPSTGEKKLYGEWLPNAQGEDVVAGIRTPLPIRTAAARTPTSRSRRRCPRRTASSSRIARDARDALPRHAGSRVHHPGRQALHAAVPRRRSARRARPCASRSTWRRRGSSRRTRPCCASIPAALDQLLHPTLDPTAPEEAARARPRRRAPARRAATSSSAPTRPSGARARASRSSWCASRRRPRTSTA